MIHEKYYALKEEQEKLITRKNEIDTTWYNGVYDRYKYPVITLSLIHIWPLSQYDAVSSVIYGNPYYYRDCLLYTSRCV